MLKLTSHHSSLVSSFVLTAGLLLPLVAPLSARADTVVSAPASTGSGVTVVPGGRQHAGMRVAVVAATDAGGDPAVARRALRAANFALNRTAGFAPIATGEYTPVAAGDTATGIAQADWGWPLAATDFQKFGKALKAPRALTIAVTPDAGNASYNAVAELYDTKNGALVGRGEAHSIVTPAANGATDATLSQQSAVDSAVQGAVIALSQTAQFSGIVVSRPFDYQTRISLGEKDGIRNGARVEYLQNGTPFAYGTVIDVGAGEAVATVAPETAYPAINVNTQVRIVNVPTRERAGLSAAQIDEKDNDRFERNFTVGVIAGAAIYYLGIKPHRK